MPVQQTAPALDAVARLVRPLLPPGYRAVLFGSRAAGTARPTSDWDIGILGARPLDGATLERIREAIEGLPTLHTLEVVDLTSVAPAFREAALSRAVALT